MAPHGSGQRHPRLDEPSAPLNESEAAREAPAAPIATAAVGTTPTAVPAIGAEPLRAPAYGVWPLTKRLAGLARTRAHLGGALAVVRMAANRIPVLKPIADAAEARLDAYSQRIARAFDAHHNVETYERLHLFQVEIGTALDPGFAGWMTCPINPDFLDEIIRRIGIRPEHYAFVDIGAGKGAAVMIASKFPFRRLMAIEFSTEFVAIGRRNVGEFAKVVGRPVSIEWVCQDFMTYDLPGEDSVFFLNNPFPDHISLRAARHIEDSLRARPRRAILVWRKASAVVAAYLDRSPLLRPLEWAPYWRAYESVIPTR
jgi:hypothetical protein